MTRVPLDFHLFSWTITLGEGQSSSPWFLRIVTDHVVKIRWSTTWKRWVTPRTDGDLGQTRFKNDKYWNTHLRSGFSFKSTTHSAQSKADLLSTFLHFFQQANLINHETYHGTFCHLQHHTLNACCSQKFTIKQLKLLTLFRKRIVQLCQYILRLLNLVKQSSVKGARDDRSRAIHSKK